MHRIDPVSGLLVLVAGPHPPRGGPAASRGPRQSDIGRTPPNRPLCATRQPGAVRAEGAPGGEGAPCQAPFWQTRQTALQF